MTSVTRSQEEHVFLISLLDQRAVFALFKNLRYVFCPYPLASIQSHLLREVPILIKECFQIYSDSGFAVVENESSTSGDKDFATKILSKCLPVCTRVTSASLFDLEQMFEKLSLQLSEIIFDRFDYIMGIRLDLLMSPTPVSFFPAPEDEYTQGVFW